MENKETYLIRVWLPDRPGALGAVASRLGSLRGDVVGLEIVERGGGQAIDELVVCMPSDVSVGLIVREVSAEEDVEVEDIRKLNGATYDPQLDVLEAAAIVLGADNTGDLADALAEHACRAVRSSWACVSDRSGAVIGAWGDCPNSRWIQSFVSGSPAAGGGPEGWQVAGTDGPPMDAVWLPLPAASAVLVVGRESVFRAKERQRLAALARIADAWFRRMRERSDWEALLFHPSRA